MAQEQLLAPEIKVAMSCEAPSQVTAAERRLVERLLGAAGDRPSYYALTRS